VTRRKQRGKENLRYRETQNVEKGEKQRAICEYSLSNRRGRGRRKGGILLGGGWIGKKREDSTIES